MPINLRQLINEAKIKFELENAYLVKIKRGLLFFCSSFVLKVLYDCAIYKDYN